MKTLYIGYFALVCTTCSFSLFAQSFTNGSLNGTVTGNAVLPALWNNVTQSDTGCLANYPDQYLVSPDLTNIYGPDASNGINGSPYGGTTFVSGLLGGGTNSGGTSIWHEGIKQQINGFGNGNSYRINFYQAVIKQSSAQDNSGGWSVYVDDSLIGNTLPSHSNLPYNSNATVWEFRTVQFTAWNNSHTIKFLPYDDDTNGSFSSDTTGALRMGIDEISLEIATNIRCLYEDSFIIHPNPIIKGGTLTIEAKNDINTIEIFDESGNLITFEQIHPSKQTVIDSKKLRPGLYFIKLRTDLGEHTKKIQIVD